MTFAYYRRQRRWHKQTHRKKKKNETEKYTEKNEIKEANQYVFDKFVL